MTTITRDEAAKAYANGESVQVTFTWLDSGDWRDVAYYGVFDEAKASFRLKPKAGDGVSLIAAERIRQIEAEGWTPERDDAYEIHELACAAACYVVPSQFRDPLTIMAELWPWDESWWKPGDRVRELTKAGALIAAEIDRLKRAASREVTE